MNPVETKNAYTLTGQSTPTTYPESFWSTPIKIKTIINDDSIDVIYKEHSMVSNNFGPLPSRVFKITFSCQEGKWHRSEPKYGEIIGPTKESYEFED